MDGPRESFLPIGQGVRKGSNLTIRLLNVPIGKMDAFHAAMERILSVICRQLVLFIIQFEFAVGYAVAEWADDGSIIRFFRVVV